MIVKSLLAVGIVAVFSLSPERAVFAPSDETRQDVAEALRARGPAALDELFVQRDALIGRRIVAVSESASGAKAQLDRELAALDALIDQVGAQKYCTVSRLFWYTDFDQALAAAQASGKPILSLRLLGRLTDELSCANSRFFRATLYANREIAKTLRDRFVLHWASVRPVPRVTIDFGDGRKLHRTLTGNSIHYVLDSRGRVIDGLPGLYGPRQFEEWLTRTAAQAQAVAAVEGSGWFQMQMADYHGQAANVILRRWGAEIAALRVAGPVAAGGFNVNPTAEGAGIRAVAKSRMERPVVSSVTMSTTRTAAPQTVGPLPGVPAPPTDEVRFDESTVAFIRSLNPAAGREGGAGDAALNRILEAFRRAVAADSAQNEMRFHRRIHEWLGAEPVALDALNERVYTELFLTPRSDPWLGLRPDDAFSAVADDGVELPR